MNKKKAPDDTRMRDLEADLMSEIATEGAGEEVATGRRHVKENSRFQQQATQDMRHLFYQQGYRRRHPERVLGQYLGVTKTTTNAGSLWEKSLIHETKKSEMPHEFKVTDETDGMANQLGVVNTALDNYKASKNKFKRMHLVGV